jgi:hypothetical protein
MRDSEEWDEPTEFHDGMSLSCVPKDSVNTTLPSPPRSALVTKLFSNSKSNNNKNKSTNARNSMPQSQEKKSGSKGPAHERNQASRTETRSDSDCASKDNTVCASSLVDERVAELENEIKEFKRQNKLLQELRAEADKERDTLHLEKVPEHMYIRVLVRARANTHMRIHPHTHCTEVSVYVDIDAWPWSRLFICR